MAAIGAVVAQKVGCQCFRYLSKLCSKNETSSEMSEDYDEIDHGVHVSNNFNVTCCASRGVNTNQDEAYIKNGEREKKITIPTEPSKTINKRSKESSV